MLVAHGEVAQLGERRIRIAEVESSNLFFSTRRQKYRLVLRVLGGFCLTFSGKRLQKAPSFPVTVVDLAVDPPEKGV